MTDDTAIESDIPVGSYLNDVGTFADRCCCFLSVSLLPDRTELPKCRFPIWAIDL